MNEMQRKGISTLNSTLRNSRGQMSIFVALIFQVLFVFFAMAINIGLLVHDKINLQNSVDLAAYYGAQRMAEMMNVMGHINYQIRQDYKVFSYRLRVIGSLGYDDHPTRAGNSSETRWNGGSEGHGAVCTAWLGWIETVDTDQNICRSVDHEIRELPPLPIIAGFIPINVVVSQFVDRVRNLIQQTCESQKDLNWTYAATAFHTYRMSVARRKQTFRALANNLAQPMEGVLDMDAIPIVDGMRHTLEKNLTQANFDSLEDNVQFINGLEDEATTGLPNWLAEIFITPQVFYVFHQGSAGACQNIVRNIRQIEGVNTQPTLAGSIAGEPATPELHSSIGFEKNPWRMAYVGVKATTKPRKPFAPFGEPVTMTARAFAKPFGGRIGPWHTSRWAQGNEQSGSGKGDVDPLVVPRVEALGDQTVITPAQAFDYVPNFSKYPGDQLGMRSNLAQRFVPEFQGPQSQNQFGLQRDFAHINQIQNPDGDPLALDPGAINDGAAPGGRGRTMELAIAAPNLFDITYYAIESNFDNNYGGRAIWDELNVPFSRDLGSFIGQDRIFDTQIQVNHANNRNRRTNGGLHFYVVTDPRHMLTSWHQKAESDYTLDDQRFGRCEFEVPEQDNAPAYPALCLKGGRSGYSVKLVSKSYLTFEGHEIGGDGEPGGAILNQPPEDF